MKLERKVYENRAEKVGDFFIGVALCIGLNIVLWVAATLLGTLVGGLFSSDSFGTVQSIGAIVVLILECIPFVINIGVIIYFGLTRYWIALGMLGAIALALLITACLVAGCFLLIGGVSGGFGN